MKNLHTLEDMESQALDCPALGSVARFSSDGKLVVQTGLKGDVKIWCTETGKSARYFPQARDYHHHRRVEIAGYAEQMPRIVSDDAQLVATLRCKTSSHRHGRYRSIEFTPDGQRILAFTSGATVHVWHAASGKYIGKTSGAEHRPRVSSSGPEGVRVVRNFADKSVEIRKTATGESVLRLTGPAAEIRRAFYSPQTLMLVTVARDQTLTVWNETSGSPIATLDGHVGAISDARFSSDGLRILTASSDMTAAVWEAVTGRQISEMVGHADIVSVATYSPDERRVVTASKDKSAAIWDAATGLRLAVLAGHNGSVSQASFSPDGRRVITLSADRTARLWDADTGLEIAGLTRHTRYAEGASWLVEGVAHFDSPIVVATSGRGHRPDAARALISADSRWLFYQNRLHDIRGPGRSIISLPFSSTAGVVRFSPQPGRIASLDSDGIVVCDYDDPDKLFVGGNRYRGGSKATVIARIPTAEDLKLAQQNGQSPTIPSGTLLGFDTAGEFLLTHDDGLAVWEVSTGKRVLSLGFDGKKVRSADFSLEGDQVFALCDDGAIQIFSRDSGKLDAELCISGASIISMHRGPGEGTLAVVCSDEILRIFDTTNGDLLVAKHVGPIDALTCTLPDSNGKITILSCGVLHRLLFTKNGNTADSGAQHFRLDGHPLATKEDVAAFLKVPKRVLNHALSSDLSRARYKSYDIPKRTGGTRRIDAPTGILRSLLQELSPLLQAAYEAHPSAHGFVMKRSIVTNAAPHTGKRWVLNIDLADFFPSTNLPAIRALFRDMPFSMGREAAQTMAELCTYRYGLPQGAPTSPVLSNLAAGGLDLRLASLAEQFKLTYSRYADDITFSTNAMVFPPLIATVTMTSAGERLVQAGNELIKAVESCGFRIKPSKTRLQHATQRQEVTGLGVNERVNVSRKRIRKLRAMLHAWDKYGLEAAASEHFRQYSPRATGSPPRHSVATRNWRRDPITGSWEKQTKLERLIPDRPITHYREPDWKDKRYRAFFPNGRSSRSIVPASFRRIIIGNLAYLHMVRGAEDQVLAKLCLSFARLDTRPPRFVSTIARRALEYARGTDNAVTTSGEDHRPGEVTQAKEHQFVTVQKPQAVSRPVEPEMIVLTTELRPDRTDSTIATARADVHPGVETVEPFALAKFAVTFAEWDACLITGVAASQQGLDLEPPSDRGWGRGSRPVINVSWNDVQSYLEWFNRMLGLTGQADAYRLPTEKEWEHACRAGAATPYHTGDEITAADANFDGRQTDNVFASDDYRRETTPVGSFAPNAWGFHDMHGNVWEWCEQDAALTTGPSDYRALRGGSWSNGAIKLTASNRWLTRADYRAANIGLRLARSVLLKKLSLSGQGSEIGPGPAED